MTWFLTSPPTWQNWKIDVYKRQVESRVGQKDTENKKHWLKIIGLTSAVIITCIGGLAAVLGANSGMSLPNLSSDDTDDMDNDYDDYE